MAARPALPAAPPPLLLALLLLALLLRAAPAAAFIPTNGQSSPTRERAALPDSAYLLDPDLGLRIETPAFTARFADLPRFPAIGTADAQMTATLVHLRAGATYPRHIHPRGTELIYVSRGALNVSIEMEALRVVNVRVPAGKLSVVPVGLPHTLVCVSKKSCGILFALNSADPGGLPV